jgi:hypothetical protein
MVALGGEDVQLLLVVDLNARWGRVVSVTLRPLFTPGIGVLYPLNRWLGGPKSLYEHRR